VDYRPAFLGDLAHLGQQATLAAAMPDLVVANFLLDMAPGPAREAA
jgi:hypothetical protein